MQSLPHAAVTDSKVTRTSEKKKEHKILSSHFDKIWKFPQQQLPFLSALLAAQVESSAEKQKAKQQIRLNAFNIYGKIHDSSKEKTVACG